MTLAPESIVINPNPDIIMSRFSFPVSKRTAFISFRLKFETLFGGVSKSPNWFFHNSLAFSVLVRCIFKSFEKKQMSGLFPPET